MANLSFERGDQSAETVPVGHNADHLGIGLLQLLQKGRLLLNKTAATVNL